ncbi:MULTISPECIES: hypothetical protein [unclassified Mesorhizobium]|uniref:hypothetical protein n=1 Tax=unclassified Mesorhizobium TaxID=325217 RepID=UPI000FDA2E3B|nr:MULTISPECIES: hypothetical protein [unclassified Mesorhizobium]TGT76137.1 hypothetical protein EN809_000490 [Mesorhizobium sp. M2E.F.Ca.ET.166.01.1.1]TGW02252.1 hypothetical protein EN797_000490 [Mesorhizobium sp. M2E.F.Ca.ET.154.01.1.1]
MTNDPITDYIIRAATARDIDPNVALTVARGEGGLKNPFRHGEGPAPKSQAPGLGPLENSFGPFQLYISGTGAGLGDRAVAAGVDPRKNWQGGVDFALDEAKRAGWGQWYGAKAAGITGRMGIGGAPGPAMASAGPVPAGAPTPFGDLVAPQPVAPAAAAPGVGEAIAAFMQSRKDRDAAAQAEQARRQALFGGGLGSLYG